MRQAGRFWRRRQRTKIEKKVRVYPYANMFSHAVGYASNGRFGIEAQANYYLINSNTRFSEKVANDVAGKKYPGDSVITTLDVDLQQIAYDSLGMYSGAVIVSEPSTGGFWQWFRSRILIRTRLMRSGTG